MDGVMNALGCLKLNCADGSCIRTVRQTLLQRGLAVIQFNYQKK